MRNIELLRAILLNYDSPSESIEVTHKRDGQLVVLDIAINGKIIFSQFRDTGLPTLSGKSINPETAIDQMAWLAIKTLTRNGLFALKQTLEKRG